MISAWSSAELLRAAKGRIGKEAIWVMLGMASSIVGSAAIIKTLTSQLSREQYGAYALAVSATALYQSVAFGSINNAVICAVPEALRRGRFDALLQRSNRLLWPMAGLAAALAGLSGAVAWLLGRSELAWLALATLLMLLADQQTLRTLGIAHAARLRKHFVAQSFSDSVLKCAALWSVLALRARADVAIATLAAATTLVNLIFVPRVMAAAAAQARDEKGDTLDTAALKAFALPLAGSTFVSWLHSNGDRWLVERVFSVGSVAVYAAGSQVAFLPAALLSALFLNLASPILFARVTTDPAGTRLWVHRLAACYLACAAVAWSLWVACRGLAVRLLLGRSVWEAAPLIPILAAAWILFRLAEVYVIGLMAFGHTRRMLLPNLVAAFLGVGTSLLMLRWVGLAGAAWGFLISSAVRAAAMLGAFTWSGAKRSANTLESSHALAAH